MKLVRPSGQIEVRIPVITLRLSEIELLRAIQKTPGPSYLRKGQGGSSSFKSRLGAESRLRTLGLIEDYEHPPSREDRRNQAKRRREIARLLSKALKGSLSTVVDRWNWEALGNIPFYAAKSDLKGQNGQRLTADGKKVLQGIGRGQRVAKTVLETTK